MKDAKITMRHISFETLKSLYEKREEHEGPLASNVFSQILEKGNLEMYKWLNIHFHKFIFPESYKEIYVRGLIDHIIFTEEHVPRIKKDDPIGMRVSRYDLVDTGLGTCIDSNIDISIATRYTEWLIAMGRIARLQSNVLIRLIRRLFMGKESATVDRLFVSLQLAHSKTLTVCISKLLSLASGDKDHGKLLTSLMGQSGLLDTQAARQAMIFGKSSLTTLHWDLDITHRNIRLAFNLLSQPIETVAEVREIVKVVRALDDQTKGAISQFGMTILNRLLQVLGESPSKCPSKYFLIYEILSGFLLPSLGDLDPVRLFEVYYSILASGPEEMLKLLFGSEVFVRTANDFLLEVDLDLRKDANPEFVEDLHRASAIIKLLGDSADISVFYMNPTLRNRGFLESLVDEISARITRIPSDENLPIIADKFLYQLIVETRRAAGPQHWAPLIEKYHFYMGESCLQLLILMDFSLLDQCFEVEGFRVRLLDYILSHLTDFLLGFLSHIQANTYFPEELRSADIEIREFLDAIINKPERIIMGSKVYVLTRSEKDFLKPFSSEVAAALLLCNACKSPLVQSKGFFTRSGDPHGLYYCPDCTVTADKFTSAATCNVCLCNDADLEMTVIPCGHCYCTECLTRLMSGSSSGQCAACRGHIQTVSSDGERISFADAVVIFLQEWTESPARCIATAKTLSQTHIEGDSDEDSWSDDQ